MQGLASASFMLLDEFLIFFYRLTGCSFIDYLIGTFLLAAFCVFLGELSIGLAINLNAGYLDGLTRDMISKERLSLQARERGDKTSYEALNKQATEVWGKRFFTLAAYSAGMLWPVPFALGWMQTRFGEVEFPLAYPLSLLFGDSVGFVFTYLPLYILARMLFSKMRKYLPYFKDIQKRLDGKEPTEDRAQL